MNPFTDGDKADDEIDDFEFLSHPHQGARGYMLGGEKNREQTEWEQKRQQLLTERRRTEERMLQSSYNSLGLLHESEQVGMSTAEELIQQREKLRNIEKNTDEINSTMRISQKHINSMKSIFSGIKGYFSKNSDANKQPVGVISDSPEPSKLQETLDKNREESKSSYSANHPAFRVRGIDVSGFAEVQQDDAPPQQKEYGNSSLSKQVDQQLDKNLDEMTSGLGRLKYLAIGLGSEIDDQNETLDRITGKVERADDTVERQNRQLTRLLKK